MNKPRDSDALFQMTSGHLEFLASGGRPWLLLVLLCLALYLPGITSLPPVDRDEARYVQATRQMLETGDFLRIRFQDEARNKKPAGIYWLQAASVAAFSTPGSTAIWPYRLVSVAGALAAVLLIFAYGAKIFDRPTGLLGAAFGASTLDLVFEAHIATTDTMLLATAVAAQGALATAYVAGRHGERSGWPQALIFWVAQGCAILIKGPVVPVLSLLTAATLVIADRRWRWLGLLHPLWGVPLAAAIVAPWLYLIQQATGGAFLNEAVGHDFLGKLVGAQEAHGAPPGLYLALASVTFWPVSLFLGLGLVWGWRNRRLPTDRLLWAWLVPYWFVLEMVPTKLPHYVLPLYPALALLCARGLIAHAEEGFSPARLWRIAPAWIWSIVGWAAAFAIVSVTLRLDWTLVTSVGATLAFAAIGAGLWQFWWANHARWGANSAALVIAMGLFFNAAAFGVVLPYLKSIWLSTAAASLVAQVRRDGEPVTVAGYAEPSLVFLLGTNTKLTLPADAGRSASGLVVVAAPEEAAFRAGLAARHATARTIGNVSGFDYSNGKWLTLDVYRMDIAS